MSVQNPYNLLNRSYEVGLAEISVREKSGLLALLLPKENLLLTMVLKKHSQMAKVYLPQVSKKYQVILKREIILKS